MSSRRSRHVLSVLLLLINTMALIYQVEAQDSQGFITLDCGLPAGNSYVDEKTGIKYISDEAFVETGVSARISPAYNTSDTPWLQTLRSFPQGQKNCYTFVVENGTQFLVRATFMNGNYEGNSSVHFSLYADNAYWDDVIVGDPTSVISKEIVLVTTINYLFLCLINVGGGTPFISLLELRPLKDSPYSTSFGSLVNIVRFDLGSRGSGVVRYPDDSLDRLWKPLSIERWNMISTLEAVDSHDCLSFLPPPSVMRTASSSRIDMLDIELDDHSYVIGQEVHVYLYFAEIEKLGANQSRQFYLSSEYGPVSPNYLKTSIVHYAEVVIVKPYSILLTRTRISTLPPLINAVEVYYSTGRPLVTRSDQGTVDSMMDIKHKYGVRKNWQADPCVLDHWDGVTCYYDSPDSPPKIKALNLSFSGLVGAIAADIYKLTYLEALYLANNKLNGTVPPSLIEMSEKNLLLMNLEGNPHLCLSPSCKSQIVPRKTKKRVIVFLVLVSIAASLISVVAAIIIFRSIVILRMFKSKKQGQEVYTKAIKSLESMTGKKGRFTYSQLLAITNNLKVVLGQGGSGTVYHGYLQGNEVAVKILFSSSVQGYKQFHAEVDIILRVHHGNLLSLIGYCDDNNNMGLIYEYMANGNLQEYISGDDRVALSWEERLRIALGVAHGLEYLHSGCEPQIVHRDVKTANILLNEKLLAKLADFGLSRSFPATGASHLFTDVAGTFGYFDPEYFRSH